ncbi:MAG TPA: hypothetical protein VM345_08270 [Acidimicrobiales bacterium]|nr:hypothetical protein [Acidimicrobiales bacterium]
MRGSRIDDHDLHALTGGEHIIEGGRRDRMVVDVHKYDCYR